MSRMTRILTCTRNGFPGSRTGSSAASNCSRTRPTSGHPATRCAWKNSPVSGGGKSEISKPITDAVLTGPVFIADLKNDFDRVAELIDRDYSSRFLDRAKVDQRLVLAPERSLGSVIKLLTPDPREYTPAYNTWLEGIPQHVKELVFVVKRYFKPAWGAAWRDHFSVDIINGTPGNELKCDNSKLVTTYLRVGFDADGAWRTFGLRKDFHPAVKEIGRAHV